MNYYLPLNYNLKIIDLDDYETIDDNKIIINNFVLYVNNNGYIYKISSVIEIKYLLDFMNNYENIVIKKIYYFLIIKFLINFKINIDKDWYYIPDCIKQIDEYDIIVNQRSYYLSYNNKIIITDKIKFNICLIINNKSYNKSFIGIIDNNCDIECLDYILDELIDDFRFSDIIIKIIGGSIDNIDKIIKLYLLLKKKRISKYIFGTYLFQKKELNRLRYDMKTNKIRFVYDNIEYNYYNNNINNYDNYYSPLHRIK
jgi:hypothetical protein